MAANSALTFMLSSRTRLETSARRRLSSMSCSVSLGDGRRNFIAPQLVRIHKEGLVAAVVNMRNHHRPVQLDPRLLLMIRGTPVANPVLVESVGGEDCVLDVPVGRPVILVGPVLGAQRNGAARRAPVLRVVVARSEEHTSELQS